MAKALRFIVLGFFIFGLATDGQIESPLYLNELNTLAVYTTDGITAHFKAVTVTTRADQAQGLMYIRHLPLDQGMVFSHSRPQILSMWMKNTYVPLDMWFVDSQGRVSKVVKDTTPHSLVSIKSDVPVSAVIEVNAGLSTLLGVTKGATIKHQVFQ